MRNTLWQAAYSWLVGILVWRGRGGGGGGGQE